MPNIPQIGTTFTDAPAGSELPTGIYDVDFQTKVNNILDFYSLNTTELNQFLPEMNTAIDDINDVLLDAQAVNDIYDAMILYIDTNLASVVTSGWNSVDNFKNKTLIHNGYWWISATVGDNINSEPAEANADWLQGSRSSDTYIASNPTLVPNSEAIANEVIITRADYDTLGTYDANTIYNITD